LKANGPSWRDYARKGNRAGPAILGASQQTRGLISRFVLISITSAIYKRQAMR
jgi:hypothetical protein